MVRDLGGSETAGRSEPPNSMARTLFITPSRTINSQTFIRDHAERLPNVVAAIELKGCLPAIKDRVLLSQSLVPRVGRKIQRTVFRRPWDWEITAGYLAAFKQFRPEVVLAEFGPTGVGVVSACIHAGIPLVVHFHGYDASVRDVIGKHREGYRQMFHHAAAIVVVSRAMVKQLADLRCPEGKIIYNPCGVDCESFCAASVAHAAPVFLAVGRMVEKKAPHLTILAFRQTLAEFAGARLRMIGDGPLLSVCGDLTAAMGIQSAVEFLGAQPHDIVRREMRSARAFVQHSITGPDGNTEGTPVSVLEASASGLPVIATKHAGIPDVVINGHTGLLVDERDVGGMANHMLTVAQFPEVAAKLGHNGAIRVRRRYEMRQSISRLARILDAAAHGSVAAVRTEIQGELDAGEFLPTERRENAIELCRGNTGGTAVSAATA